MTADTHSAEQKGPGVTCTAGKYAAALFGDAQPQRKSAEPSNLREMQLYLIRQV